MCARAPRVRPFGAVAVRFIALCLLLVSTACSDGAGRFTIAFSWEEGPPETGEFWIHAFVEERIEDPSVRGNELGRATPVRLEAGARIDLSAIPNGPSRVAVVEIREGPDRSSPLAYFGESEPFDLEAGADITVNVRLSLRFAPSIGDIGQRDLVIQEADDANRVGSLDVTLEFRARGADSISAALDPTFLVGREDFAIASDSRVESSSTDDEGFVTYRIPYNLNSGLNCGSGECADGLRSVFVRALSQVGIASDPLNVRVILDTTPPQVTQALTAYLPDPNNPLFAVDAAKAGTTIAVTVFTSEAIAVAGPGAPQLTATNGSSTLTFDVAEVTDGGVRFEVSVGSDAADGTYTPQLSLTDTVGNPGSIGALPNVDIVVDNTPPVLNINQNAVSYIRSPLGNANDEQRGDSNGFLIPAGPYFALAPADPLDASASLPGDVFTLDQNQVEPARLQIWLDEGQSVLVGDAAPASPNGDWLRSELGISRELSRVWVSGVDDAGNQSASVLIENSWFVATTNAAAAGSSPHTIRVVPQAARSLAQDRSRVTTGAGAEGLDRTVLRAPGQRVWTQPISTLLPMRDSSPVYDSVRGRVVRFGGEDELNNITDDTWEWNGYEWTRITPDGVRPTPRRDLATAYDARRGRVVVYGGFGGGTETWEWDGERWENRTPVGGDTPGERIGPSMAYDALNGRIVLFGGILEGGAFAEDAGWAWDGESWSPITPPTGTDFPGGRWLHRMTYDSSRNRIVLFGGLRGDPMQDTWVLVGDRWTQIGTQTRPTARYDMALAYDENVGRVVLYGGIPDGATTPLRDLWELNGNEWASRGLGPFTNARGQYLVFDRSRGSRRTDEPNGRLLLFAGIEGATIDDPDTPRIYARQGTSTNFELVAPATGPEARNRHAMAYDATSNRRYSLMYGGINAASQTLQDTWRWDGSRWFQSAVGAGTGLRQMHAMAYDPVQSSVLKYGGVNSTGSQLPNGDMYRWNGSGWVELNGNLGAYGHVLAFKEGTQTDGLIVWGTRQTNGQPEQTYRGWNGTSYTSISGGSRPSRRIAQAAAYDSTSGEILMFGGRDGLSSAVLRGDTWSFGTAWSELSPSRSPSPRSGHQMVQDTVRGTIVLFGGQEDDNVLLNDVWEWDGSDWTNVTPPGPGPTARYEHAMSFDSRFNEVVVFGGRQPTATDETWLLGWPTSSTPAQQFEVQLPIDISIEAIAQLRARAFCGGLYEDSDADADGAQLMVWTTGGDGIAAGEWRPVATNGASVDAPTELAWTANAAQADRTVVFADRKIAFQCRPNGPTGGRTAEVSMDYFDAWVRY